MSPYSLWMTVAGKAICNKFDCITCRETFNSTGCVLIDNVVGDENMKKFIKIVTDKLRNIQKAVDDCGIELELDEVDWRKLFNDAVDLIE